MNLGIDFGSTYSMLAYYDEQNDMVQPVQTQNGSRYIPSVACFDYSDELITGQQAKDFLQSDPTICAYRAFKMLLNENDPQRLSEMNYTEEYSPRRIAKDFLRQQIVNATKRCKVTSFDKVVICIPKVWNKDLYTMSGKAILQEICMELKEEYGLLEKVVVVSEPAAASAYFAYLHKQNTGTPYGEYMLVVDYGGGTLDISLTQVTALDGSNDSCGMQIHVVDEAGAGENHQKQVGDAGIAYQEGTVRMALKAAGFQDIPYDGEFIKAVNNFESALINKATDIRDKINFECANQVERLADDHDVLTTLFYKKTRVPITYSLIYQAYTKIIQPVLAASLEEMMVKCRRLFDPLANPEKLKLALVGGFGQFELVRCQVHDFFQNTQRTEDGGREDAVCFGAALIADGVVSLKKVASMSMGLVIQVAGENTFDFAITKNDELEYDQVCYMKHKILFGGAYSTGKATWEFAVGQGDRTDMAYRLTPLKPTQDELNRIVPRPT